MPDAPRLASDDSPTAPAARPNRLAHDVNNMLGVIIGHVGMALRGVRPSDPLHPDLVAIQQAAERAAALMKEMRTAGAAPSAITLPASSTAVSTEPDMAAANRASEAPPPGGAHVKQWTVLVVEDEPAILTLVTHVLRGHGYAVLRSNSATEAIAMAEAHTGSIDLLLTDVMMPEMNGRDLSRALCASNPGLRTVLMSGYTAELIAAHGVLDADVSFLQKPFAIGALTEVVQQALGPAP